MSTSSSLSNIRDYFKKSKKNSRKEWLDEFYKMFVSASAIGALVINPALGAAVEIGNAAVGFAGFKFSTLLNWLPDRFNYKNKGRERSALERFETAGMVNILISQLAIRDALNDILIPVLRDNNLELILNAEEVSRYKALLEKDDEEIFRKEVVLGRKEEILKYASLIYDRSLNFLRENLGDKNEIISGQLLDIEVKIDEAINLNYQAYLLNLVHEFPEFAFYVEHKRLAEIKLQSEKVAQKLLELQLGSTEALSHLENLQKTLNDIKGFFKDVFSEEFGMRSLIENNYNLLNRHLEAVWEKDQIAHKGKLIAHHNYIKSVLSEPVGEGNDIQEINYPRKEDIFIPQSFRAFVYREKIHGRTFLDDEFWKGDYVHKGEDIGGFLLRELARPENRFHPIILLGNPGSGKSLLSNFLAARLVDSKEFVPFYIKLRDVTSESGKIKNHINEGIAAQSASTNSTLDWTDMAKSFPERQPVVILDGLDELLKASTKVLSGYLEDAKELLKMANFEGLSARILITSRLPTMQSVSIPTGMTIIKLDPFDKKRQNLWVRKWNESQSKEGYQDFRVPVNKSIFDLAKEPLLLFMLAIYDFESGELQKASFDNQFNQSQLYDRLFQQFTLRQLKKDITNYSELPTRAKREKEQLFFRLRLGLIAQLMFLNDSTNINHEQLENGLEAFKLHMGEGQGNRVEPFSDFFFIHDSKASAGSNLASYNFEFLHKTFGEFLAADFIIRIFIASEFEILENLHISREDIFRYCMGNNFLHKHPNIIKFLIEYYPQVINEDKFINYLEGKGAQRQIIRKIKRELRSINDTSRIPFPIGSINLLRPAPKPILDHLAIYSQNLIILWVCIEAREKPIAFNILDRDPINQEIKDKTFTSQDRDETDRNKAYWKKLASLWTMVGNRQAAARLKEWINILEEEDFIYLKAHSGTTAHFFYDSAEISCNHYEKLLASFVTAIPFKEIDNTLKNRPELKEIGAALLPSYLDYHADIMKPDDYLAHLELLNIDNEQKTWDEILVKFDILEKGHFETLRNQGAKTSLSVATKLAKILKMLLEAIIKQNSASRFIRYCQLLIRYEGFLEDKIIKKSLIDPLSQIAKSITFSPLQVYQLSILLHSIPGFRDYVMRGVFRNSETLNQKFDLTIQQLFVVYSVLNRNLHKFAEIILEAIRTHPNYLESRLNVSSSSLDIEALAKNHEGNNNSLFSWDIDYIASWENTTRSFNPSESWENTTRSFNPNENWEDQVR